MEWRPDLELSDEAVTLRPYHPGDAGALFEAARESIPDVYPWLPWCHPECERSESEEWISNQQGFWIARSAFDFAITDTVDGTFLGGCGISSISWLHRFANLGYWIRSSAAGRGVATGAARLTARFGFEELDLQRLDLVIEPGNSASIRVAEKLGARPDGLLRNRLNVEGDQRDALMFSLIAKEWLGRPWQAPGGAGLLLLGAMEFDAEWIVPAIFVGVMLVRALGGRLRRAAKKSQPTMAKPQKTGTLAPSEGFATPDVLRIEGQVKPIEPR